MTQDKARELAKSYKHYFVGRDGLQQYNRVYTQRPNEVNAGVFAHDPRFLQAIKKFVPLAQKTAPIDLLPTGLFGPTVIGTNFTELFTVSGCPMDPMTYNPSNNESLREELKLCSNFLTPRDVRIFDELIGLRYSEHDGSVGKISKISGSGFPYFSHDIKLKVAHLNYIANNVDRIFSDIRYGKFNSLLKQDGIVLASSSVLRTQAEGGKYENGVYIPKERMVNSLEYALSNGVRGSRFPASKRVVIDGIELKDHFAGRARSAYSVPNPINTTFTAAVEGLRHYADNKYEFTYKHRTKDELSDKAAGFKHFLPLDVGQYDQSIPWFMVERWLEKMPFTDAAREVITLLLKAPKFYSAVNSKHDPIFTGDPESLSSYEDWGGLPSGAFLTSMLGKDMFTFAVLTMFDRYYHDVLGNIDSILKGKHKYAIFNASDDTIIMSKDKDVITFLQTTQDTKGTMTPYFKVEIENGLKFLGNCGYTDDKGKIKFCSDIGSFLKNSLVPERGIRSKLRKYAMYGLMIRREIFQDHPLFFEMEELWIKSFRDEFKINWYDIIRDNMVMPSVVAEGQILSQSEIEVLLDPSKLYYKVDEKDVSSSILDNIEEKISAENTTKLIKSIINF